MNPYHTPKVLSAEVLPSTDRRKKFWKGAVMVGLAMILGAFGIFRVLLYQGAKFAESAGETSARTDAELDSMHYSMIWFSAGIFLSMAIIVAGILVLGFATIKVLRLNRAAKASSST